MVPDLNYEYHTITIDSNGQAAANTFTSYLEIPLKNVVEAKLLAAHVHTKTSNQHIYIRSMNSIRTSTTGRPPCSTAPEPSVRSRAFSRV